jgi:hypothetical protein
MGGHKLRESDKTQANDASWKLAYGAPETLPVSQEIEHGPTSADISSSSSAQKTPWMPGKPGTG